MNTLTEMLNWDIDSVDEDKVYGVDDGSWISGDELKKWIVLNKTINEENARLWWEYDNMKK